MTDVFVYSIPARRKEDFYNLCIDSWNQNGFNVIEVNGSTTSIKKNHIVFDSVTNILKSIDEPRDLIISEDDCLWTLENNKLLNFIDKTKLNWISYQKYLKAEDVYVGSQALYIPKEAFTKIKEQFLASKPKHLDRLISKEFDFHIPFKAKEYGKEMANVSSTMYNGRVRPGLSIEQAKVLLSKK
tara:strand:- start:187 stop:741 length:555 start_codon:yes stop_codon:yes gene_type:complete